MPVAPLSTFTLPSYFSEDFAPNFFELVDIKNTTADGKAVSELVENNSIQDYRFRCVSFEIGGASISLERAPNFDHIPKEFTRSSTLTVKWIETANLDIRRFHSNWMSNWYNKETDSWMIGSVGKKRTLEFKYLSERPRLKATGAFLEWENDLVYSNYNKLTEDQAYTIKLIGAVPQGMYSLDFDWEKNSSSSVISFTYSIDDITITKSGVSLL
jgi:hypothetical protein